MKVLLCALPVCVTALVIVWKHTENLKRMAKGIEVRISYLWKGEKEIDRIKANNELNSR